MELYIKDEAVLSRGYRFGPVAPNLVIMAAGSVYTISDRFNPNYVEKDGSSPPTGSDVTASSNTKFSFWASRAAKKKEKMRNLKRELEMDQHKIPLEELCRRLRTNPTTGLSQQMAAEILALDGPNKLSPTKGVSEWTKLAKNIFGGFQLLLWAGALLCLIAFGMEYSSSNDPSYDNMWLGVMLILLVTLTGLFAYYQERKSCSIMESFLDLIPQAAEVVRDGRKMTVKAEDLVVGDVVDVKFGDRLPADIRLIQVSGLKVDNSSLTGESEPQSRSVDCTHDDPLETKNLAFFSSSAVEGVGRGIVVNVGDKTAMGRIASLASGLDSGLTPMAREIAEFVHLVSFIAIGTGAIIFTIAMVLGYSWLNSVIFLIGVVMSYVPEGLVATIAICLTLTAQRMAKKQCLVKNLEAVETLGSTSVICSDKTGTLTQNRMTVSHVWLGGEVIKVDTPENESEKGLQDQQTSGWVQLARVAKLCSRAEFKDGQEDVPIRKRDAKGDASEVAILRCMEQLDGDVLGYRKQYPTMAEIPFNSTNKFQVSIHRHSSGSSSTGDPVGSLLLVMKGAPERIAECCSTILINGNETMAMDESAKDRILKAYLQLGGLGERVLGFCDMELSNNKDHSQLNFNDEGEIIRLVNEDRSLRFVGLISMIDPPRPAVPDAVQKCRAAGIRVVMVTGDHPVTAKAIARSVGIISEGNETIEEMAERMKVPAESLNPKQAKAIVIHGQDLKQLDEDQLDDVLQSYTEIVFARTSPQQKLIIVEGFQRLGKIVAVTGDGVNDSPALKKADIGIAMGITGSDVSKQAADMVLLDDNFASIVTGVEEGRLIFENLKKSIAYTMITKIPEVVPFVMFILANTPLALGAIPILCIDIGTDMMPAISFAYERPESDIMQRPPRNPTKDKLVGNKLLEVAFAQTGLFEGVGGFFTFLVILAQNGFWPSKVFGIRAAWDNPDINDLEDSYGQEWTYDARKELEKTCYSAYLISVVVQQWSALLTRKTRRLSVFQHGFRNEVLNFALVFETCLVAFFIYTPGVNQVLQLRPVYVNWWFPSLGFSIFIFAHDELRKCCIRHFPDGFIAKEVNY